ncbi:hypothetical protein [Shewanella sp. M-Br]|uniref:hypothetical protein n=1 Tax=Shewanella sp. M-Br TaxID=2495595 RepID=UPI002948D30B|nr:hypothetical protein SMBr_32760 [Shewanella sp. M-Br]
MSTTKDRSEYFKQYHIENGDRIRARKLQLYTEKKVLSQMDKYLVDKDLLGLTGSIEREKFAAKEIARPIGERTAPCDYQLVLDAHKKLGVFFNGKSTPPLEFFTTKPILLGKFYKFCADLPEFDKYKEKLVSMYTKIEQQHAADLATVL